MNVVFSADRKMLSGLHVAAYSVLASLSEATDPVAFSLFSSDLSEHDVDLLRETLDRTGRPYSLSLRRIDEKRFAELPQLQASSATYFRLVIPQVLEVDRFLYLDSDILCQTDLRTLYATDLNSCPIGLVSEAPIHESADPDIAQLLGMQAQDYYFNAGVMLVDPVKWRKQDVTTRCLEFVKHHQPKYHDQSSLNFVLHGKIYCLPAKYNCRTNSRESWPALLPPNSGKGSLLHFVDYPKPWSPFGRFFHPLGQLWWRAFSLTAYAQEDCIIQESRTRLLLKNRAKYKQSFKDSLLFLLLRKRLISTVKGMRIE